MIGLISLVEFRCMVSAVRTRMRVRGMRLLDAFRAFDSNKDGKLSSSELYGGLQWLGMKLKPDDVHAIVRHIDRSGTGAITFDDFELALYDRTVDEDPEFQRQLDAVYEAEAMEQQVTQILRRKCYF